MLLLLGKMIELLNLFKPLHTKNLEANCREPEIEVDLGCFPFLCF